MIGAPPLSQKRARLALLVFLAAGLGACSRPSPIEGDFGGDPHRGKVLITQAGCGSCHQVPGVAAGDGMAGPSLASFGQRAMIAGVLANTPENLVRWLRDPQRVVPGNAMPQTGLSEGEARDVAAYLYTLR